MKRCLVVLLCLFVEAAAAVYPEKPIRFVIPSAPGGSPDVLMRILLAEMSKQMGVSFVVENKPAASYVVGTMDIVRSPADGFPSPRLRQHVTGLAERTSGNSRLQGRPRLTTVKTSRSHADRTSMVIEVAS